ncbi:hypothetical protein CPC08DRAFT_769080 [Agrocybe pediades]|nr:hypothetical protein CPC08DRAFT_769080 [Agrocybe pediades]
MHELNLNDYCKLVGRIAGPEIAISGNFNQQPQLASLSSLPPPSTVTPTTTATTTRRHPPSPSPPLPPPPAAPSPPPPPPSSRPPPPPYPQTTAFTDDDNLSNEEAGVATTDFHSPVDGVIPREGRAHRGQRERSGGEGRRVRR